MIDWLDKYSEDEVSNALSYNLEKNIAKISSDDLSIIVLKRIMDATV